MESLKKAVHQDSIVRWTFILYLIFSLWWGYLFLTHTQHAFANEFFGFAYGAFSLWGGIWGFVIAQKWGGFHSAMGKAIMFISFGLLAQAFGQYSFWYMNTILHEVPYPGIPDIGYFGTIPFYIVAAYYLLKAAGGKLTINSLKGRLQIIIIPVIMLALAYFLFVRNYGFDWNAPLSSFLDIGYPVGQAIYTSIAILTYSLSRKLLGGVMRGPIFFIIIAFIAQFLSDYVFIYFHESYFPGSFIDFLYLTAYFVMTLGLLRLRSVMDELG